uniref:Uncharacterized protein n=1 Tax=Glossina palpalis gambiensis TaxID=67801 RepID=A0A1B0C6X0_9MUSC
TTPTTISISTLPTTSPPPLLHNCWPYCSLAWRSVLCVWCLVFGVPLKEYLYYNTNRITFYICRPKSERKKKLQNEK